MMKEDLPDALRAALDEERIVLTYSPRFRECNIVSIARGSLRQWGYEKGPGESALGGRTMDFCPWTGKPLPGSLRDEWFDVIWDELGIGDFDIFSPIDQLPEELLSEEWWIRRGIGPTNEALEPNWDKPKHTEYTIPQSDPECLPGLRRPPGKLPHSCDAMVNSFDRDPDDMIAYLPWTREYGIRILDPDQPVDHQPLEIKPIRYCPWCGDGLPESLREEWQRRLAAMGLTPGADGIPERLMSDAWWREAGL